MAGIPGSSGAASLRVVTGGTVSDGSGKHIGRIAFGNKEHIESHVNVRYHFDTIMICYVKI